MLVVCLSAAWRYKYHEQHEQLRAAEHELTESTKRYAKEIGLLKIRLQEKELQLATLQPVTASAAGTGAGLAAGVGAIGGGFEEKLQVAISAV